MLELRHAAAAALLAALAIVPATPGGAQGTAAIQPVGGSTAAPVRGGGPLPLSAGGAVAVRQITVQSRTQPNGIPGWIVRLKKAVTGTGFAEIFLVVPPNDLPHPDPRPLVVAYHSFGVSYLDILNNTTLVQEAQARGWYLLACTGAADIHFSSIESQIHTQLALSWIWSLPPGLLNVDPTRVYAIGFSMGGGAALNFAARNLDPTEQLFAAEFCHTGTVSLPNEYADNALSRWILNCWHDSTCNPVGCSMSSPCVAEGWSMRRSSVSPYDDQTLQVEPGADLARNLVHTGVKLFRAANDPEVNLLEQNSVLAAHLLSLGMTQGVNFDDQIVPGAVHDWVTLDESAALDWLGQFALAGPPPSGSLLADGPDRYFHFDVAQDAPGVFTPFTWSLNLGSNALTVSQTANLNRLTVHTGPAATGLSTAQTLTLTLSTMDGTGDRIVLTGYPQAPSQVLRDGVPNGSWTYVAFTDRLVIPETHGGTHVWTVVP